MTCPFPQRIAGTDARNVPEHKQRRSQNAARRTAPPFRTRLYRDEQAHAREPRIVQSVPLALLSACSAAGEEEAGVFLQVAMAPLLPIFAKESRNISDGHLMNGNLFRSVSFPGPGLPQPRGKKQRDDLVRQACRRGASA